MTFQFIHVRVKIIIINIKIQFQIKPLPCSLLYIRKLAHWYLETRLKTRSFQNFRHHHYFFQHQLFKRQIDRFRSHALIAGWEKISKGHCGSNPVWIGKESLKSRFRMANDFVIYGVYMQQRVFAVHENAHICANFNTMSESFFKAEVGNDVISFRNKSISSLYSQRFNYL